MARRLQALLTPRESVVALIDYQLQMFFGVGSHERFMVLNNALALAEAAKLFEVPVILTTVAAAPKRQRRNRTMTRNRNPASTVAAILAIGAILSLGGVTASLAGSNDGGAIPLHQSNGPDRARAAAYPEARHKVQIQQMKRAPPYAAPGAYAYGAYAADREQVPSARVPWDFPRGAQGGW
jgi:nicotinamidase-related amidase